MFILASDAARITGGSLFGDDVDIDGLSFDSRLVQAGQCFVALEAERDGHAYVDDAYAEGASVCIVRRGTVSDDQVPSDSARIEVDDTMAALTALGRWAREEIGRTGEGRVIGVTGSSGKTSTKDFIAAVLAATCDQSFASELSYNNDIGVPTTLFNAPEQCDAIVIEMGMRGFGEIARLCELARPNIGVITSIGEAHSERVGGIEGVARAKGELLMSLSADGIAIVCADDPRAMHVASQSQAQLLTFGIAADADVRYNVISFDQHGRASIVVTHGNDSRSVVVPVPGAHMASNAVAAIAVGVATNADFGACVDAIANAQLSYMRMQWETTDDGVRIMNDAYNANPDSMVAALTTLSTISAPQRVAVVGVMAEIADAPSRHLFIADTAKEMGIELWTVGTDLYGQEPITIEEAAERISRLPAGAAVLLKGSRVAALERVVDLLGVAPPRQ
jgi:UDP-N-acetylmuramoyl-tripeptide--D-alanyl-D-alanine ligase